MTILSFADAGAWHEWLAEHHEFSKGLWLRLSKKGSGIPSVTYVEALDEALCHGGIDGQKRFSPRGPRSVWSKINVGKVAVLEETGRMRAAGTRAAEAAKADGRWEAAYDGTRTITVPDDLIGGLSAQGLTATQSCFACRRRRSRRRGRAGWRRSSRCWSAGRLM